MQLQVINPLPALKPFNTANLPLSASSKTTKPVKSLSPTASKRGKDQQATTIGTTAAPTAKKLPKSHQHRHQQHGNYKYYYEEYQKLVREHLDLQQAHQTFHFKYKQLESVLLETEQVIKGQKDEIEVLKHSLSSQISDVEARQVELEKVVAAQNLDIMQLQREKQMLEISLREWLKWPGAGDQHRDESGVALDETLQTQPPQQDYDERQPQPQQPDRDVVQERVHENSRDFLLDASILSRPDDVADTSVDEYKDVLDQLQKIKTVLREHTDARDEDLIDPPPFTASAAAVHQQEMTTVSLDRIYRSDSKDIFVQSPKKVVLNEDEKKETGTLGSIYDEKSLVESSILKPPTSPINQSVPARSAQSSSPTRRVDANPTINAIPISKPPLLYPPRPQTSRNEINSVSYQDLLAANDRFIDKITAPDWKPVEERDDQVPADCNLDLDRAYSPASSRSPSPTKSMLIRERDALEEELLLQYENLRRLLER